MPLTSPYRAIYVDHEKPKMTEIRAHGTQCRSSSPCVVKAQKRVQGPHICSTLRGIMIDLLTARFGFSPKIDHDAIFTIIAGPPP